MDIVTASSDLRQLLVAHDNCNRQIATIDGYIYSASQRQLRSYIDGNHIRSMHLALRLSIIEGIHSMYTLYQQRKWLQVQQKARSIMLALQDSEQSEETEDTPLQPLGSTKTDRAARQWSNTTCQFYRNS